MRPMPPRHIENSDVLPSGSVAVAANAVWLFGAPENVSGPKLALPLPSVVTLAKPRNVCPSPNPDLLHSTLAKNSSRYCLLNSLLNVPEIVAIPPSTDADVNTG